MEIFGVGTIIVGIEGGAGTMTDVATVGAPGAMTGIMTDVTTGDTTDVMTGDTIDVTTGVMMATSAVMDGIAAVAMKSIMATSLSSFTGCTRGG